MPLPTRTLPDPPADDAIFGEDDEDIADDGPTPAFPWHIPEVAPVLESAAGPPLVNGLPHGPPLLNGFHAGEDDLEDDGLVEAMHGPWAVFHPPDNFPE